MKKYLILTLLIALLLPGYAQNKAPEGFVSIFNGKDFTGWNIKNNAGVIPENNRWKVENGVMHCYGAPSDPYIILTEKNYENFELRLEFKMTAKCNSGVLVHQPDRGWGRESRLGMELQVQDDAGKEANVHTTGAIYNAIPPMVNAVYPAGYWNTYYITLDWPFLLIQVNGQIVQNVNLEDRPDLKYRLRSGHIGLQNHGREVEYRNIYVRELPSKENAWTEIFNGKDLKNFEMVGNAQWKVENGVIVATGGSGFLVSKEALDPNYELHVFSTKSEKGGNGGVYYNWENEIDRGYKAEFYDFGSAKELQYMNGYDYMLTQVINYGAESRVILNGIDVLHNDYQASPVRGKIAIYHSAKDGTLKVAKIRMKQYDPPKK
ncbi:MAG: DUF1080 domain-containing protein [Bacteroidales bacterium]|jgi:hypothetical protein|nr:DUF1080 domain-containing protein [Bacteroidales bacterium]